MDLPGYAPQVCAIWAQMFGVLPWLVGWLAWVPSCCSGTIAPPIHYHKAVIARTNAFLCAQAKKIPCNVEPLYYLAGVPAAVGGAYFV